MRNKSNLPYLITIVLFVIGLILLIIEALMEDVHMLLFNISATCLWGSIIFTYTICPIALIFQFIHKNKTLLDKFILGLNCIGVIIAFSILMFTIVAFPNKFKGEKDIRKQIKAEQEILNKEYQPVLDYLSNYKKQNGIYPTDINKVIPKSDIFDKYEYHLAEDKKGYWLQVYTINPPIEYYYNDEFENGYNYYKGDGIIDGAVNNDHYYQIDDKWHAIMLQHFTRHSKIVGEAKTEKQVDTWMKDNVDMFDKK